MKKTILFITALFFMVGCSAIEADPCKDKKLIKKVICKKKNGQKLWG